MILMYSSKIINNNSHDKTTTSRARYSRNDSSDDDNLHTDRYKQEKWYPDVAPRGDERQERMHTEKRIHDLEDDVKELEAVNKRLKEEQKIIRRRYVVQVREISETPMGGQAMWLYWPIWSLNSVGIICSLATSF
jgi:hypothetical protein